MARTRERLTALQIARLVADGMYPDGDGLYLQIKGGVKSWVFRFTSPTRHKERYMGLGRFGVDGSDVSLKAARTSASNARSRIRDTGRDPIDDRAAQRTAARAEATRRAAVTSFGAFADRHVENMRPSWYNAKHADQWAMTLRVHAAPIRDLPIDQVDTPGVLSVLKPLWHSVPETARRLRSRIEIVLDAARAEGLRSGENPARWRGHLKHLLPKQAKLTRGHNRALPYSQIGVFMQDLRAAECVSARALEFLILCGTRTGETILAEWTEVNFEDRLWVIPKLRTKTKQRDHRVPLSDAAIAVLKSLRSTRTSTFVFPGWTKTKETPLSDMAMAKVVERLGYKDAATVHGFRSTFKDWASDRTSFPNEASEMALGHSIGNKVEAAYRRGDLFEKRRKLADAWARFCSHSATKAAIIPFEAGRRG